MAEYLTTVETNEQLRIALEVVKDCRIPGRREICDESGHGFDRDL